MADGAGSLLTVHLLAKPGHSLLLQQALDRLLAWICPDTRLFLVCERATAPRCYERHRKRSWAFPGIAVLLFLQEDLGEERIIQMHEQLQCPPWHQQRAHRQSHRCAPAQQDFYSLDEQMPAWGIRRVPRGPEVLCVTLYCSFDNYEDAVRLYELLLQQEAALQGSTSCTFLLHASQRLLLQLCLKQLPPGVAAEPPGSSALQFRVQEMGQLVPLLPNPCVPISRTRWQTQDYEGNTILLQVQDSSKHQEANLGLSHQHKEKLLQDSAPAPLPGKQSHPGWRSQELRAMKGRTKPDQSRALTREQAKGDLHRPFSSPHAGPAAWWCWDWDVPFSCRQPSRQLQASPQESRAGRRPTETNVDTGVAMANPARSHCPLSCFSRELQSNLLLPPAPMDGASSTLPGQDRTWLLLAAARRTRGAKQRASGLERRWASPADTAEDQEEEFFI